MRKAIILGMVVFIFSTVLMVFAQENQSIRSTVWIDSRIAFPELSFYHGNGEDAEFTLGTEHSFSMGIYYSTRGFSIGLSTDAMFGSKMILREMYLSWFGQRLGFNLFHQNYRDYYLTDEGRRRNDYNAPNEYPNLRVMNTGLSGYWFFRDNNFRGLNTQSEEILIDSWSPFIKTTVGRFALHNDSPLIPESFREYYDYDVRTMHRGNFYHLSLSIGITGTYTVRRFYMAGMLTYGGMIIYQRWDTEDGKRFSGYALDYDLDFQYTIGYMGSDYFFGLCFIAEGQSSSVKDLGIQITNYQQTLFVGRRI